MTINDKSVTTVTHEFTRYFEPQKALLIYQRTTDKENESGDQPGIYIESYDIGPTGKPINAHPLTLKEMSALATLLGSAEELQSDFLRSKDLLPKNVLLVNYRAAQPCAIWYSRPKRVHLSFIKELKIPSGEAWIPGMIWKASREELQVFAYRGSKAPVNTTPLYHAPFFNIYESGGVCMGNVDTQATPATHLEDFIDHWEKCFFGSYFSHTLMADGSSKANIVQLWKNQVKNRTPFPYRVLKKTSRTLKQLAS